MKSWLKTKRGGRGKVNETRSIAIIILREIFPKYFTYQRLGSLFNIDRKTAHDIYKRDRERYLKLIGFKGK